MRRLALLLWPVILLAASPALAEVDVRALIATAPPAASFPGDDIVVLLQEESIDVAPDGRVVRRVHTVQRLQTQWAMRSRSDVRVAWDSQRQDLEVLVARTFMRDGTEVATPPNGLNEVTPDAVSRAAPFLDIRELVISHVGTEPGCVVELAYEIRDRQGPPLPPSGICWLGGEHPVLEARVTIAGARARRGDLETDGDGTTAWTVRDLPAFRAEGSEPWRREFTPHVVWTTLASTADLARELRRTSEAAAGAAGCLSSWLDRTRADPQTLTDADLIQRIAAFSHDGHAEVQLPGGAWARAPRLAEDVCETAVATAWERAVVTVALLRLAGHEPELGVFRRTPYGEAQLVDAGSYERLRVVVRIGDENWWLAPERSDAWVGSSDLPGWTGLFLANDGGHRSYTVPVQAGSCGWSVTMAPAQGGDGWTATGDLVVRGPFRDPAVEPAKLAAEIAAALFDDGEVTDLAVRIATPEELSLRLTAKGTLAVAPGEQPTVRELPWPAGGVLDHLPRGFHAERPARSAPLWVEAPGREQATIRIEVPAGWHVDGPAEQATSVEAETASFTWECKREGTILEISRTIDLRPGRVDPPAYPALREVLAAALQTAERPLVILADE